MAASISAWNLALFRSSDCPWRRCKTCGNNMISTPAMLSLRTVEPCRSTNACFSIPQRCFLLLRHRLKVFLCLYMLCMRSRNCVQISVKWVCGFMSILGGTCGRYQDWIFRSSVYVKMLLTMGGFMCRRCTVRRRYNADFLFNCVLCFIYLFESWFLCKFDKISINFICIISTKVGGSFKFSK